MSFWNQIQLTNNQKYDLSSRNFSDSFQQIQNQDYSSTKKKSISNNNLLQDIPQNLKKSPDNCFFNTISFAQNRIMLTKFKLELSSLKKQFAANFQNFHLIINKSHHQVVREIINQTSINNFSRTGFNAENNANTIEQVQIREKKIIKLKQKIAILKEQNEKLQLTKSNFNDFSFEEQIKEKDQFIQSIESEYNEKILQLNSTIQEQKIKIKSFQDQKFLISKLEYQIDLQNTEIDQLKTENSNIRQNLEQKIKQNEIASNDIEYTFSKIEQFKKEIGQCNQENSKLQSQINILNHELEISKESNLEILNENKRLKSEINQKEEQIKKSIDSKNVLISQIKEKNGIISQVQNEISVLSAEKSLNQSISTNTVPTINEFEISCLKYNSKDYRKLKNEVIFLNSQIESQKNQIEEQNNLIQALRENLQQNENEIALICQNSQKDKSAIIKKEGQTLSLKSEIIRLENVINQKEQFISEILDNDNKRAAELDRLHMDLEEARNNLQNNNIQSSDHLSEEFQKISEQLKNSRSKINKLDIIVKQQKYQIQEIQQENDDLKNKLNCSNKKNLLISEENNNLQEKFKTLTLTYTSNASKMQKVIEFIKKQNLELSNENSIFMKKNLELQENLNSKIKSIDQLSVQVNQLKKENSDLIEKINFEYIPLKNDNNQLKKSINEIRNHEQNIIKENQKLVIQVESLKKEKETQKNIDDKKINERESQINQIEDQNYENKRELKKYQNIIQSVLKILNVDSINSIVDTIQKSQKDFSLTKSKLTKILNEKKKIESVNKLQKIKIKSQENQISQNKEKINELSEKLKESKKQTDSLNSIVNQSKENFKILQNSFSRIQNQMEDSMYINLGQLNSPSNRSKNSNTNSGSNNQFNLDDKLPLKCP